MLALISSEIFKKSRLFACSFRIEVFVFIFSFPMQKYLPFFLLFLSIGIIIFFLSFDPQKERKFSEVKKPENSCFTLSELTVNGDSMSPFLKNGEEIIFKKGFYDCNSVERGDMMVFSHAGNKNPLVKLVKAREGDRFQYDGSTLRVNGKILKNSEGKEYSISSKMLNLYATSYPVLPEDTFLVLGDNPSGTKDASKFGLIHFSQVLGKAEKRNN
jgi:signal peptidase I